MSIHSQCKYSYIPRWMWAMVIMSIVTWILILVWGTVSCFAMGNRPELNALKVENAKLADKVTGIEQINLKLADKVNAQAVAMAGVNNVISKVSSEIKAGRDVNTNTSNDKEIFLAQTELYKYQIKMQTRESYKLYGIIILLINALIWIMKKQANDNSNARFYQVELAKRSNNGDFEDIMKLKREHDKQKTLLSKAIKTYKTVTGKKEA